MLNEDSIRKDFPILNRKINGKRLVYLDNAATSQKPTQVISTITDYYENHNANVHRGIHTLSEEATAMYEEARRKVQRFINARYPEEIIFTKGTTDSINLVAYAWGLNNLDESSSVAFTELEHHSNLVPWQVVSQIKGTKILPLKVNQEGFLDEKLANYKENNIKIIGLSHASNFLSTVQDVKNVVKEAHALDSLVLVDGAQAIPHMKVDVQSLGCDFYAFSGHKMLGPTGIGVLYVRKEHFEKMGVYQTGGGMINEVFLEKSTYAEAPGRFEAGTPNVSGAVGLSAAIEYLEKVGMENVRQHELELMKYAFEKLTAFGDVEIYGPKNFEHRTGVLAFNVKGIHSHDLASVLDTEGVAIRSGHHCAMPIHSKMNLAASARASFYLYNTKADVDVLALGIEKARRILGK